jgi:damage-control phosphatase, subfamily I
LKTYFDCYPCFLRQALSAARLSGADEPQQRSILQKSLSLLQGIPSGANPPEIGYQIHQIVCDIVGTDDPYRETKKLSTQQALKLYPKLKGLVRQSNNPLEMAIRISIAGNIIDFGVGDQIADLWETVDRVVNQPYAIDHVAEFMGYLKTAPYVLYLADNAGETVFDRVLIETMPIPVIYTVKSGPFVNDATMEDALAANLDTCATLISNGAQAAGTILALCSEAFRKQFEDAPMIIAKGQANFETLSDAGPKVFCLLQVKCPIIGLDLHLPVGSIIARQSEVRGQIGDTYFEAQI